MYRIVWGVTLLVGLKLFAAGAWYKEPQQISKGPKDTFFPSFVILKIGVFSNSGDLALAPTISESKISSHCDTAISSIAWVTHRLSENETLKPEAGKNLGNRLKKLLSQTCFTAVELDIEPLKEATPWLATFLKGVRETLPEKIKLRLAVPVLSPRSLEGNFWTLRDGVQAMAWVDGLDVMAYDSGAKDSSEFSEIFKNTFFFVMELIKQTPGKDIIVGLPAYQDKTKLHKLDAENLTTVLQTLKPFTPFQIKPLCNGEIKLAYYAGWTLTKKDQETHKKIEEWTHDTCKKTS